MDNGKDSLPPLRAQLCHVLVRDRVTPRQFNAHLYHAAVREGVGALLARIALDSGAGENTELGAALRTGLREQLGWSVRVRHATGQILAGLGERDLPAIALRGRAVAESLYGERADLRGQSDIDLLCEPARETDLRQLLWDLGFRPSEEYPDLFMRGEMVVDVHTEPLGIERIRAWAHLTPLRAGDFFAHAETGEIAGEPAPIVAPRVLLPYLCFHALKHSFERLVWLYDIALLAREVEANGAWEEVAAGIRDYRLERPCHYALAYVRAHLEAPVPEELLAEIRPKMGLIERRLFARHMRHEQIPYLAERLFARMQPDLRHRLAFWRETIYPRYEVRRQIAGSGCVKCHFIRKRLRQLLRAAGLLIREFWAMLRSAV